jgi:hypothetical protein
MAAFGGAGPALFVEWGDDVEAMAGVAERGDERVEKGGADTVVVGYQEAHGPRGGG